MKQLSKLAGVSVRTLHYYDEIGLLIPTYVKDNGYRYYEEKELLKLQQILFYKELEFALSDIIKIINSPHFNMIDALYDQRKLLELKKKRLSDLILTIDNTVKGLEGGEDMSNDDLFKSFGDDNLVEYIDEVKKRWGNTDAYKQSIQRTKHWTKKDYERIKEEGKKFTQTLADSMDKDIKSPEVQLLVAKHHDGIKYFYDCPYEMYRSLGQMYVDDPRFTAYYDKFKPGLASWLRDAIVYYCDIHTVRK